MRKLLASLLVFAVVFGMVARLDAGEKKEYTIGVSLLSLEHVFFNLIQEGVENKAAELGVKVLCMDAAGDSGKQFSQIQDFITQNVDAIIFAPVNSGGSKSMVSLADAAGIPIFTMDVSSDGKVVSHVATDNYKGGRLAAEWALKNILTDKKGDVCILGYNEVESCVMREKGFVDYMKENAPDVKIIDSQTYSGDQMKAVNVMQDMLTKFSKIDMVFGTGDMAVLGGMTSATSANRFIPMIGFDGNPEGVAEIKKGGMFKATIAQKPHEIGGKSVENVVKYLNGEKLEPVYLIDPAVIDITNAK